MSPLLKRPQPATWWLQRAPYFQFMMRELSALTSGLYSVVLLFLLYRLSQGPEAYLKIRDYLRSWWMVLFHFVALGLALLHTITWFNATPRALVVMRGEEKVPEWALVLPSYLVWIFATAGILWAVAGR